MRQRRIDLPATHKSHAKNKHVREFRAWPKNYRILRTFSTGERRRLEDMSRCLIHGPRLKVVFSRAASRSASGLYGAIRARPTFELM